MSEPPTTCDRPIAETRGQERVPSASVGSRGRSGGAVKGTSEKEWWITRCAKDKGGGRILHPEGALHRAQRRDE